MTDFKSRLLAPEQPRKQLTVTIPAELHSKLVATSADLGVAKTRFVAAAIEHALEEIAGVPAEPPPPKTSRKRQTSKKTTSKKPEPVSDSKMEDDDFAEGDEDFGASDDDDFADSDPGSDFEDSDDDDLDDLWDD